MNAAAAYAAADRMTGAILDAIEASLMVAETVAS
jgi:hypothetical protein